MNNRQAVAIAHRAPGRVRFRLPPGRRDALELRRLREALLALDGVNLVEANPLTGSVLVVHQANGEVTRYADVFSSRGYSIDDHTENGQRSPEATATVAEGIDSRIRELNERVEGMTDGRMDLRTLVPLTLLGAGLLKLLTDKDWKAVPPYVLLYYAFDTYWKLHDRSARNSGR